MPRSVLRVVLALVALAAVTGLWLGLTRTPLTETAAIEAAVARYVAETGGKPSDCAAIPGDRPEVWIVVNCGTASSGARFRIGHDGQLMDAPPEPQT